MKKIILFFYWKSANPNILPEVSLSSEVQVWLDGLVCLTRQSFVMLNPSVRVTHLMLTLKV